MRVEPAGTVSPFEGDTIFTNALANGKNPMLLTVKEDIRAITMTAGAVNAANYLIALKH